MIDPEMIPLVSALIVGVANFCSILLAYYRMERRFDKKADQYWKKVKKSDEGKAAIEILEETRKLLKSGEAEKFLAEAKEAFVELRALLKKIRKKSEAPPTEEEEEEGDLLPRLGEKKAGP